VVAAAVSLVVDHGVCRSGRVVLGGVGPQPYEIAASALAGQPANAEHVAQAAELADQGLEPSAELYASSEYKKHLARVMTKRALLSALGV